MEVLELAEIVNGRFNDLCRKIDELKNEQDKRDDACRVRHTELDRDMTKVKERQSILAVITGGVATALGGMLGWLK